MNITRENYEVFIVDYLDGKLDPIQSANLIHFLSQNPDLEEEFNEYENMKVNPTKNIKLDKQILKKDYSDVKNINNDNFDEFCIARFEGDLKRCDELRLKEYLKEHPEKLRDFILYSKLYLIPDYSIKYSKKYNIKKISPFVHTKRLILYSSSIAAATLILIMLLFRPGKNIEEMSKIQVINNVTEEQIISQEDYINNLSFNEMLTRKEDNLHLRENIINNKIIKSNW
jgi:hypothetical protein